MKRKSKNAFESKNEIQIEQLHSDEMLLSPICVDKPSAERTVSEMMRSEYASSDTESATVATQNTDELSVIGATVERQNITPDILVVSEDDDAFSLDDTHIHLIDKLELCEDCSDCDCFDECFGRKES